MRPRRRLRQGAARRFPQRLPPPSPASRLWGCMMDAGPRKPPLAPPPPTRRAWFTGEDDGAAEDGSGATPPPEP